MLRSARTAGVTVTPFMPPRTATFSASVVGKSVTASRALRLSPAWRKLTMSVSPGPVSSMTASQSRNVRNRRPRALTSTSPATTPARPAGPPGATWVTRRPGGGRRFPPAGAPPPRRDGGLRVAEQVGERVAYGYDPLPDHQVGALPERSGREARRVQLQHRDVRERVLPLDLRGEIPSVARRDDDLLRPLRDVLVRDDHAVRGDDEAGPIALYHLLGAAGREELLEGVLRQAPLAPQDVDAHHRRSEPAGGGDDGGLARLAEILGGELWRQCRSRDRRSDEQQGSCHRENLTRLTRARPADKSGPETPTPVALFSYLFLGPTSRSSSDAPHGSPSSHCRERALVLRSRPVGPGPRPCAGSRPCETADRCTSGLER